MKEYFSLFRIKLIATLQYRTAAVAGISTQLFFGIVFISVYIAFFESNASNNYPMQLKEVVAYLWLNQAFFALTFIWLKDNSLLSMIRNGNIAYELCRPINFYGKWYFTMLGHRLSSAVLRFLPVLVLAFLIPEPYRLMFPKNIATLFVFLIALIISLILVNAIGVLFHLITFFTLDEKGIISLMMAVGEIFSGATVPIAFFPKVLQTIAYLLPFRYICDLPFRIYSGNISVLSALPDLLGGILWIIVIIYIGYLLANKALKNATIQGG